MHVCVCEVCCVGGGEDSFENLQDRKAYAVQRKGGFNSSGIKPRHTKKELRHGLHYANCCVFNDDLYFECTAFMGFVKE